MTTLDDLLSGSREDFTRKVSDLADAFAGRRAAPPRAEPFSARKCATRQELGDWFVQFAKECRALRPEAA